MEQEWFTNITLIWLTQDPSTIVMPMAVPKVIEELVTVAMTVAVRKRTLLFTAIMLDRRITKQEEGKVITLAMLAILIQTVIPGIITRRT